MNKSLQTEQRYLKLSSVGNLIVGIVGLTVAVVSSSQAILLDGLFNLTYFATGLFTIKVATLVAGGDDDRFPHGYAFFEPLVNGVKGMLVLGVSIMALVGAIEGILAGGRSIAAGVAVGYGVFASVACWIVALATRRGEKQTRSPLVAADAENWIVNAAISSCVLVAFIGILVLDAVGLKKLTPFVDPVVVLTIVLISIGVPVRMAWRALMELLNQAPNRKVVEELTRLLDESLTDLPVEERFVRVIQPGRQRMVLVHIVLPKDYRLERLSDLDAVRAQANQALQQPGVATLVDVLFTTDRQWGAPLADGGAVVC